MDPLDPRPPRPPAEVAPDWARRCADLLADRLLYSRQKTGLGEVDMDGKACLAITRRNGCVEIKLMSGATHVVGHFAPDQAGEIGIYLAEQAAPEVDAASLEAMRQSLASIVAVAVARPALAPLALPVICEMGLDVVRFLPPSTADALEGSRVAAVPGKVIQAFTAACLASQGELGIRIAALGHGWPLLSLGSDNASVAEAGGVSNPAGGSVPHGEGE